MYSLATGYGKRPSEIFIVETELGAWLLDEACLLQGRQIEKMLNDGKDPFITDLPKKEQYRSVRNLAKIKVKIKADGTW